MIQCGNTNRDSFSFSQIWMKTIETGVFISAADQDPCVHDAGPKSGLDVFGKESQRIIVVFGQCNDAVSNGPIDVVLFSFHAKHRPFQIVFIRRIGAVCASISWNEMLPFRKWPEKPFCQRIKYFKDVCHAVIVFWNADIRKEQ